MRLKRLLAAPAVAIGLTRSYGATSGAPHHDTEPTQADEAGAGTARNGQPTGRTPT